MFPEIRTAEELQNFLRSDECRALPPGEVFAGLVAHVDPEVIATAASETIEQWREGEELFTSLGEPITHEGFREEVANGSDLMIICALYIVHCDSQRTAEQREVIAEAISDHSQRLRKAMRE